MTAARPTLVPPVKKYPRPNPALLTNVPEELRKTPQWDCWKYIKGAKVPINPLTGRVYKRDDGETTPSDDMGVGTFEQAVARFKEDKTLTGIGFRFKSTDPYTGIDLDDVRDPATGNLAEWVHETFADWPETYCEASPSGTGVHFIGRAKIPRAVTKKEGHGVEMYFDGRYFAVTGVLANGSGSAIADIQQQAIALFEQLTVNPADSSCTPPPGHAGRENVEPRDLVEPPGILLPPWFKDFGALLTAHGWKFKTRAENGGTSYDYHGIKGVDGKPQRCLVQGTVHSDQEGNEKQARFFVKDGRVQHNCFDSDCRGAAVHKTRKALAQIGINLDAEPERAEDYAKLPVIKVRAGDFPSVTTSAEKVLVRHAEELKMFQRGGQLVEVIRLKAHDAEKKANDKRLKRPPGTLMLEPLGAPRLRETFARLIDFRKFNERKNDWLSTDCPMIIVATYFGRKGNWNLPVLVGPIASPLMRLDGTLLSELGYDAETGLYLDSDLGPVPVPKNPTLEDARVALAKLYAPFAEFPWGNKTKEGHKSVDFGVVASAIISAIQRRVIAACPIHGFTAPAPRSGKSLLSEASAIIATGKPAPASAVSNDKEEFRKALTAILIEGQLIVNLDNIEEPLESSELCKVITQAEYGDRLLGESKTLCLPTNVLFTATGNSLTFRGDLAHRALLCKIDAEREDPERRNFAIKDLKEHLLEHRAELVSAALTILRAFYIAKEPKFKEPLPVWGGFEQWSEFVREPLVWAGCGDPFETRKRVIAGDPELEVAKQAYAELFNEFQDEQFTAHKALKEANEGVDEGMPTNEKLHDALIAVAGVKGEIAPYRFGWWLRKWRDRFAGGMRLVRANDDGATPAYWCIEPGGVKPEEVAEMLKKGAQK